MTQISYSRCPPPFNKIRKKNPFLCGNLRAVDLINLTFIHSNFLIATQHWRINRHFVSFSTQKNLKFSTLQKYCRLQYRTSLFIAGEYLNSIPKHRRWRYFSIPFDATHYVDLEATRNWGFSHVFTPVSAEPLSWSKRICPLLTETVENVFVHKSFKAASI